MKAARPLRESLSELVGYAYFADKLGLPIKKVYKLASPNSVLHDPRFPRPVTSPRDRAPKFRQVDADAYVALLTGGQTERSAPSTPDTEE